jgi:Helicase
MLNISDGLFNGSTGTLMKICLATNSTGDKVPIRAFLQFSDHLVGPDARTRMRDYQIRQTIDLTWTPIERFTRVLQKSGKNEKLQIVRTQLPLVACNGMTIHKSQGSDMVLVVVNVKKKLRRSLLYVACSRATSYNSLFIDGKFKAPLPPLENDAVTIELARLRQIPLQHSMKFFCDMDDSRTKIMFHNVQSFHAHHLDILAEHSFMASHILAFVEPWTLVGEQYDIPNFTCVHREDCRSKRGSYGSLVYAKDELSSTCKEVNFNSNTDTFGHVQFTEWKISTIKFVMVYKSPRYSPSTFFEDLVRSLVTYKAVDSSVIIFGDFNLDANQPGGQRLIEVMLLFGMVSVLPFSRSTDYGTCLDYCFSNIANIEGWYFESLFSYHSPICVLIPKEVYRFTSIHLA